MQRTKITASFGRTQNLGNYSNARSDITIEAVLDEGEDPAAARAQLQAEAEQHVNAVCDAALEGEGQPAKFSREPRYKVLRRYKRDRWELPKDHQDEEFAPTVVILPDQAGSPEGYVGCYGPDSSEFRHHRYAYARRIAEWYAGEAGAIIVDCSDGDLSKIPPAQTVPIPVLVPAADPYDLAADDG